MNLDDRAERVFNKRIAIKDMDGNPTEDFSGMVKRVSTFLGKDKQEKDLFAWLLENNYFWPNSPCLVNAGRKGLANQLSACYVLSVGDSIEDIFETIKETALIHKHGGGTGFNFSKIRPKNSVVKSTGGIASGPISFMHSFDASTESIKQGGTRRGANMGVLRVDHPDIMEYIHCKRGRDTLQNFNISVAITDKFMEAVMKDTTYELVDPASGAAMIQNALEVWKAIVDNAWFTGDPGVLFIDRINEHNPLSGPNNVIEATNP